MKPLLNNIYYPPHIIDGKLIPREFINKTSILNNTILLHEEIKMNKTIKNLASNVVKQHKFLVNHYNNKNSS